MKAFPTDRLGVIKDTRSISINEAQQDGMDLRDYFAAKAMQALLSDSQWRINFSMGDAARQAYDAADFMMKEREK